MAQSFLCRIELKILGNIVLISTDTLLKFEVPKANFIESRKQLWGILRQSAKLRSQFFLINYRISAGSSG